jgi:hypothetical protein
VSYATSTIKSIQRGVLVLEAVATNTATISSVDTAKSFVTYGGTWMNYSIVGESLAHLVLTNSTTVTGTRFRSVASYQTQVSWQVIEYY